MRKFLFLPHCLRNASCCKATVGETGYTCQMCGGCKIQTILQKAEGKGFSAFIVPGGSLVKKIFSQQNISNEDLVIGVACDTELQDLKSNFIGKKYFAERKIAIKLDRDGCINTDIDLEKIFKYFT